MDVPVAAVRVMGTMCRTGAPRATLKARLRSRPKELQDSYAGLSSGITTVLHKRGEMRRKSTFYAVQNSRPRYSISGEESRKKRGLSRVAAIEVPKGSDWNGHDAANLRFVWVPDGTEG